MIRVIVRQHKLLDDHRESLLERTTAVIEIHRNSGHRIVGLVAYETISRFGMSVFYEVDFDGDAPNVLQAGK